MQPDDPDVRLMLAFRDGDAAALAALYERWAARLLRYLERIVAEPSVAEELLQETFLRVLGARERYAPSARFSTWLFTIARHLAVNERARARVRHLHVSVSDGESAAGDERVPLPPRLVLVASTPAPEREVETRREQARFEAAFAALPERQRTALWLAVVEGHAYDEIASLLGTSVQSVKNLVHRARAGLADQMAADSQRAERGTMKAGSAQRHAEEKS